MRYGVKFATDDEMPQGHNVMVLRSREQAIVVYRESAVDRGAVTTAWASLHTIADEGRATDELTPRRLLREGLSDRSWAGSEREVGGGGGSNLRIW